MKRDFLAFALCHPLSKHAIAEFMDIEGLRRSSIKGLRNVFGSSMREMSPDCQGIPRDVKIKFYPDLRICLPYLRMLFNWKSCVVSFGASDGPSYTNFYREPFYDDSKPDDNQKQALVELQRDSRRTPDSRVFMGKVVATRLCSPWNIKNQLFVNEQMVQIMDSLPYLKSLKLDFEFIDPAVDLSLMSNLVELDLSSRYSYERDQRNLESRMHFEAFSEEEKEQKEEEMEERRLRALEQSEFFRNLSSLKKLRTLTLSSSSCTTTCYTCLFLCLCLSTDVYLPDNMMLPRKLAYLKICGCRFEGLCSFVSFKVLVLL